MREFLALLLAAWIVAECQQGETTGGSQTEAQTIRGLIDDCASKNETAWRAAYQQLVEIGKPALPFLAEALNDPRKNVRWRAAQALGAIGGPEVVPPLLVALEDDDRDVRRHAAVFLGKWGGGDPDVIAALNEAVHDPDPMVIHDIVWALNELGDTRYKKDDDLVDTLCEQLESRDSKRRECAAVVLGMIGSSRACAPLVEALADPKAKGSFRNSIRRALAQIGSHDAVPLLLELLLDEDRERSVRSAAASTLRELGDTNINESVLPLTESPQPWLRRAAAIALGFPGNVSAVGRLGELARDEEEDPSTRGSAVRSLGRIGDPRAVEILTAVLVAEDDMLRRMAAQALGDSKSPEAIPALLKALQDSPLHVVMYATRSLGQIGDRKAASEILELFDREDALEAVAANRAFGNLATVAHLALLSITNDDHAPIKLEYIYTQDQLEAARQTWRAVIDKLRSE